uniref:Uncharacterized protein n=1 Tax=Arundo donax TaxID=35708 RepID=A0A0A8ZSK2_ARUDO
MQLCLPKSRSPGYNFCFASFLLKMVPCYIFKWYLKVISTQLLT